MAASDDKNWVGTPNSEGCLETFPLAGTLITPLDQLLVLSNIACHDRALTPHAGKGLCIRPSHGT
jgi:hypothetical protein